MREKIHFYLNDLKNKYAIAIDVLIYGIIFIDVIDHGLQTMESMKPYHEILKYWDIVPLVVFSIEYVLRVYSSPKRFKFIFSFWGIVDFIALLPFYFGAPPALREIRFIRFLSLLKYEPSAIHLYDSFNKIKRELFIFSLITMFLLYISAVGIYYFENPVQPEAFKDIFHCLWWSVATLTTVGYGDMYPVTDGGKVFSTFIIFISLGLIAVPAGLIASAFTDIFKK